MKYIFRYIWGSLFVLFSIILIFSFKDYLPKISSNYTVYKYFVIGILAYFIITNIKHRLFSENIQWLRVFSHEFTHVVFGVLTLNRIEGFEATKSKGGVVRYHGKGNLFIYLTPYSFPLFTIGFVLIKQVVAFEYTYIFNFLIGLSYAFHLHTFYLQARTYQPDIKDNGYFQSYSFIFCFNLFFLGFILLEMIYNFKAFKLIFNTAYSLVLNIF